MRKYRLAIIGSGALGSIIAEEIGERLFDHYEIVGILGRNMKNTLKSAERFKCKAYASLDKLIEDRPDYIIEAASPQVVKDIGLKILGSGINLIPLSVGAFADKEFHNQMKQVAMENNVRIYIPSGAVGGFDVLRAAMLMEDGKVGITTEKSPSSLIGAPFLKGRELSREIAEEIFDGTAREAIGAFPKNINVAVATALATKGVDETKVSIRSIPNMKSNRHRIEFTGEIVNINIEIESIPSASNPKSSTLAAWSVIGLLENLVSPIVF